MTKKEFWDYIINQIKIYNHDSRSYCNELNCNKCPYAVKNARDTYVNDICSLVKKHTLHWETSANNRINCSIEKELQIINNLEQW